VNVPEETLTGGCLCGAIRFELTSPPYTAGYCHCTRCQRRTGTAASPQARVEGNAFRLLLGEHAHRALTLLLLGLRATTLFPADSRK
jgi:hypothetical protein